MVSVTRQPKSFFKQWRWRLALRSWQANALFGLGQQDARSSN